MIGTTDYIGRRILVLDTDSGKTLADTQITAWDKINRVSTVPRAAFSDKISPRVSVFVFGANTLHEYLGTVRGTDQTTSTVDIALFKGTSKEGRTAIRYDLHLSAQVKRFIIASKPVALPAPLDVTVVNLSTGGVLLRANTKMFNLNTTFELTLEHNGTCMVVQATVVRIARIDSATAEYGCQLLA